MKIQSRLRKLRSHAEKLFLQRAAQSVRKKEGTWSSDHGSRSISGQADFSPYREHWWMPWQLEPIHHLWRYVWLVEKARALNEAEETRASTPNSARVPAKVCVIQFGHLGDVLHTIPMLRAARKAWPKAQIRLLTGPWNRQVVDRIPYADETVYYAPIWEAYVRGHYAGCLSVREEWDFLLKLRNEQFELVVDATSGSLPTLFCMLMLRPRTGIGPGIFPEGAFGRPPSWFQTVPYESRTYEARRILNLLTPVGVNETDDTLEFPLLDADRDEARRLLAQQSPELAGGRYAIFAPGAGWPGKMWPAENFTELARRVVSELHLPVIVVGSAGENDLGQQIAWGVPKQVFNYTGKTTLGALAALIAGCKVSVTNDSGPYHLAVALDVPTVLLFGPGFPTKWARERRNQRLLHHEVGCRCYPWHPRARCEYARACLRAITVNEAWDAVKGVV